MPFDNLLAVFVPTSLVGFSIVIPVGVYATMFARRPQSARS